MSVKSYKPDIIAKSIIEMEPIERQNISRVLRNQGRHLARSITICLEGTPFGPTIKAKMMTNAAEYFLHRTETIFDVQNAEHGELLYILCLQVILFALLIKGCVAYSGRRWCVNMIYVRSKL